MLWWVWNCEHKLIFPIIPFSDLNSLVGKGAYFQVFLCSFWHHILLHNLMPNLPLMETIHGKHKSIWAFMLLSQCTLLPHAASTTGFVYFLVSILYTEIILTYFHFKLVIVVMCLSFFRSNEHIVLWLMVKRAVCSRVKWSR